MVNLPNTHPGTLKRTTTTNALTKRGNVSLKMMLHSRVFYFIQQDEQKNN